jgi:hypothetical protein
LLGYDVHDHGVNYGWLMLVLVIRDGLLLALAALIIRDMWRPWLDVVRVDGVDDPTGGIFDGAPDYWARPIGDDAPFDQYELVGHGADGQIDFRK